MAGKPLLVLDSASLYYRAYYALPASMTAPDGRPHNAIRGFLGTLTRLLDSYSPQSVVACWDDDWRPQWRVDLLPSYKSHRLADEGAPPSGSPSEPDRESEPEDLGPQVTGLAALLDALGIARWGAPDHEADDVIGSLAAQHSGPVIVVSGDRDLVQVVDDRTSLLLTVNGGMEKWPLLDPAGVQERFGVPAQLYVDLAVLRGDPSDGLPGVPGIGAKTAAALVSAFGSCTQILRAAVDEPQRPLTPRLADSLRQHADYVERAVQVATVVTDLPLPEPPRTVVGTSADPEAVQVLVGQWGLARQVADLQAALARAEGVH